MVSDWVVMRIRGAGISRQLLNEFISAELDDVEEEVENAKNGQPFLSAATAAPGSRPEKRKEEKSEERF